MLRFKLDGGQLTISKDRICKVHDLGVVMEQWGACFLFSSVLLIINDRMSRVFSWYSSRLSWKYTYREFTLYNHFLN